MFKFKKAFCSFALAFVFALTPVHGYAADSPGTSEEVAEHLYALAEFLMDNYAGGRVTAPRLFESAARGMAGSLDDYTDFLSETEYNSMIDSILGNYKGIGIGFKTEIDGSIVVEKVFAPSPAKTAGIMKGDIILSANGKAVNGYSGESLTSIISKATSKVTLSIQRGGLRLSRTIEKGEFHMSTVEYGKLSEYLAEAEKAGALGYIIISQISDSSADELKAAIEALQKDGVTGVVMDLRGNPGGLKNVIEDISRMLVPEGVVFSTIDKAGNKVTYSSMLQTSPFKKMCILVDGDTASASELFASAMQDAGAATIIGAKTYGKGVIQSFAELPSGDSLKYTSMEYMRRSGKKLNGIGITPDIEIKLPATLSDEVFMLSNNGTGNKVPQLKEILTYMGYKITDTTNLYDTKTQSAVKELQAAAKLNTTGTMDTETIKAVNIALSAYCADNDEALARAFQVLTAGN